MGREGQVDHGPCKLEITTQNFHPATPRQLHSTTGCCAVQCHLRTCCSVVYSSSHFLLCIKNTFTYSTTALLLITVITTQLKSFAVGAKLGHNKWISTHALAHSKFSSLAGHAPTQSITLEVATGENLLTFCDIKDMELVSPPFTCIDNTLVEGWSSLYGLCGYTVSAYGG